MGDYSAAWRAHRFWSWLPLSAMGAAMISFYLGVPDSLFDPILVVLVACFVLANVNLARFKCPRCHKSFNSSLFGNSNLLGSGLSFRNGAGKTCGNCGLALYDNA